MENYPHIGTGDFPIGEKERQAILEVLDNGRISESKKVKEFENAWAEFCGSKYCVATSSGFGALVVALQALKYKKGITKGKVITSPLTYIADATSLLMVGLEPKFVDIRLDNFCINVEEILKAVEDPEVVGIMPIDLMGYMPELETIKQIAKNNNLFVLEDACEAHGSTLHFKKAGTFGDIGVFSFYIAHNIQAGEMGAIITDDLELYKLTKRLKAQGRLCDCVVCTRSKGICPKSDGPDPRFTHDLIGFNFKTTEFTAALALSQIDGADEIIKKRYENVKYLNEKLNGLTSEIQLPILSKNISYLAYPVILKKDNISRKAICASLERYGVETRPLFGAINKQPAFQYLNITLPNAEFLGERGFYIGCHQYLTEEQLEQIVKAFYYSFNIEGHYL